MKDILTATGSSPQLFASSLTTLYSCLLVLTSILALVGGMATSVLFFGLLLSLSLLVLGSQRLSTGKATRLRTK